MKVIRLFLLGIIINISLGFSQNDKEKDSLRYVIEQAIKRGEAGYFSETTDVGLRLIKVLDSLSYDDLKSANYNLLGLSYYDLQNLNNAEKYANLAKDYAIKHKDTLELSRTHIIMAYIRRDEFNYKESINYAEKALEYAKIVSSKDLIIESFFLLSGTQYEFGNFEDAIDYLDQGYKFLTPNDKHNKIKLDIGYGFNLLSLNKVNEAITYFKSAETVAADIKLLPKLNESVSMLSQIYRDIGDAEMTKLYLNKLKQITKQVRENEKRDLITSIEKKYENQIENEKLKRLNIEKQAQEKELRLNKKFTLILLGLSILLVFFMFVVFKKNKALKKAMLHEKELNQEKSRFYSEISHELRTPLYGVIELTNELLLGDKLPSQKEYLKTLKFSGNHLLYLINNVLDFNKLESFEQVKLNYSETNLRVIINYVVESLDLALKMNKNTINVSIDDHIPKYIFTDSNMLTQVLINLVSNAVKFTRNGVITILVNVVGQTQKNQTLKFEIKDSGQGISQKELKHIFKNYYQGQNVYQSSFKGTGIGLAIVKKILNIFNTDIEVTSKLNQGTTFSFLLKVKRHFNELVDVSSTPNIQKIKKDIKVLIVDDNAVNRLVTKKVLDRKSIFNKQVSNGESAIELVKKQHFDVILMDIEMPILDGFKTSQKIRQINPDVKIIALTASIIDDLETKLKHYQINDYVLKPFSIEEFYAKL